MQGSLGMRLPSLCLLAMLGSLGTPAGRGREQFWALPMGFIGPRHAAITSGASESAGRQPGSMNKATATGSVAVPAGATQQEAPGINESWGHSCGSENTLSQGLRTLPAIAVAATAFDTSALDSFMAAAWAAFDSWDFTHNSMFEACLAVASFTLWIFLFESLHLWLPDAKKFRLDGRPPVRSLRGFGPDALDKAIAPIFSYLFSIALFHHFELGPLLFGPKPEFLAPSFVRVAVEVILGVFLYDLCFYPIHFALHNFPSKTLRDVHARHHSWAKEETVAHNASETVYHSYLDGALQVATNIFVQQLSPWGHKHPLSRALHNIIVTYLLTESHSGYDLPFMSHRVFPGIFGGSPRHELHHQASGVCYHQFFTYIDDALGRGPSGAGKRVSRYLTAQVLSVKGAPSMLGGEASSSSASSGTSDGEPSRLTVSQ